jgi:hypothetical protein
MQIFFIFFASKRVKKTKIVEAQVEKSHFLSDLTWTVRYMNNRKTPSALSNKLLNEKTPIEQT